MYLYRYVHLKTILIYEALKKYCNQIPLQIMFVLSVHVRGFFICRTRADSKKRIYDLFVLISYSLLNIVALTRTARLTCYDFRQNVNEKIFLSHDGAIRVFAASSTFYVLFFIMVLICKMFKARAFFIYNVHNKICQLAFVSCLFSGRLVNRI